MSYTGQVYKFSLIIASLAKEHRRGHVDVSPGSVQKLNSVIPGRTEPDELP